jgi:UDP-N-acetylglucosamine--N-acetylmuramyl-(pentapeptide) pyrophosphoryl-undecaprenol N-acetylglucosamine transferase
MQEGRRLIHLAAGGTGGHLFPAQALAEVLVARGYTIHLLTDERVRDYGKNFPGAAVHVVPSASLSLSAPLTLPSRLSRLTSGYFRARGLVHRERPLAAVGFGGYPSLPPILAAAHLGIPTLVHEQNSVLGRANRLLAPRVKAIATSFEKVIGVPGGLESKLTLTGNPVRSLVTASAGVPYIPPGTSKDIHVLVFGGSQGAKYFSDAVPEVLALLPERLRKRLRITQQCRPEDLERVAAAYRQSGIRAELQQFFGNLPEIMARSQLVVSRSGASTIAELGVVGRPAILVPLPGAIDNDQLNNARSFESAGAGFLVEQKNATPQAFSGLFQQLLEAPQRLKEAAAAALRHGRPDAAQRLAALVEHHISA